MFEGGWDVRILIVGGGVFGVKGWGWWMVGKLGRERREGGGGKGSGGLRGVTYLLSWWGGGVGGGWGGGGGDRVELFTGGYVPSVVDVGVVGGHGGRASGRVWEGGLEKLTRVRRVGMLSKATGRLLFTRDLEKSMRTDLLLF